MKIKVTNFNIATPVWILTALFVFLKISGVIDWSLWWVFSPVLILYGIILFPFVVLFIIAILSFFFGVVSEILNRMEK